MSELPHCLVIDENGSGPVISGAETIRALRRDSAAIGIVAHGDRPERHLASAALQAGASAYVARTAKAEELRRAVDAAAAQDASAPILIAGSQEQGADGRAPGQIAQPATQAQQPSRAT